MNDCQSTTILLEQYKNLFKNFTFNFKGLKHDTEEGYKQVVQDLGATVSKKAKYTLVDISYIEKNTEESELYLIHYIHDSIIAEKPLDIDLYKYNDSCKRCKNINKLTEEDSPMSIDEKVDETAETSAKSITSEAQSLSSTEASFTDWVDPKQISSSAPPKIKGAKNNSDLSNSNYSAVQFFSNNEEEDKDVKANEKWWEPMTEFEGEPCQILDCSFEPGLHPKHAYSSRLLSLVEKRILLKYLIQNNKIKNAKGKKIWTEMIAAGYLKHRSEETLRNAFRRTILPNITSFELPPDIIGKFFEIDFKCSKGRKF